MRNHFLYISHTSMHHISDDITIFPRGQRIREKKKERERRGRLEIIRNKRTKTKEKKMKYMTTNNDGLGEYENGKVVPAIIWEI